MDSGETTSTPDRNADLIGFEYPTTIPSGMLRVTGSWDINDDYVTVEWIDPDTKERIPCTATDIRPAGVVRRSKQLVALEKIG